VPIAGGTSTAACGKPVLVFSSSTPCPAEQPRRVFALVWSILPHCPGTGGRRSPGDSVLVPLRRRGLAPRLADRFAALISGRNPCRAVGSDSFDTSLFLTAADFAPYLLSVQRDASADGWGNPRQLTSATFAFGARSPHPSPPCGLVGYGSPPTSRPAPRVGAITVGPKTEA